MTIQKEGGWPRRARLQRNAAILAGSVMASASALASDAGLQKALLDSGCAAPRVETVLRQSDLVAYRANCLGSSHKIITIVCSRNRCTPTPSTGGGVRP